MSLFNLIWIAIFLYFGYNLTFVGFEGIDFKFWDEVVGILMLICAAVGLFCVIKRAIDSILAVSGRFKERSAYRSARKKLKAQQAETGKASEKFYDDFRADIISADVAQSAEVEHQPEPEQPVTEPEPQPVVAVVTQEPYVDPVEESLRKLREQYEIDDI